MKLEKVRNVNEDVYKKWKLNNCGNCGKFNCPFSDVQCKRSEESCWVFNKSLYSDEFLDRYVEVNENIELDKVEYDNILLLKDTYGKKIINVYVNTFDNLHDALFIDIERNDGTLYTMFTIIFLKGLMYNELVREELYRIDDFKLKGSD